MQLNTFKQNRDNTAVFVRLAQQLEIPGFAKEGYCVMRAGNEYRLIDTSYGHATAVAITVTNTPAGAMLDPWRTTSYEHQATASEFIRAFFAWFTQENAIVIDAVPATHFRFWAIMVGWAHHCGDYRISLRDSGRVLASYRDLEDYWLRLANAMDARKLPALVMQQY